MPGQQNIILWLVENNRPLSEYRKYAEGGELEHSASVQESYKAKNWEKVARIIVNSLTQRDVALRVSCEWESFPSPLRMAITNICAEHQHSGNVKKGISYLNGLLGGKIRRHETGPTERKLIVVDGRVIPDYHPVNLAAARAESAFAAVAKPSNYHKMSPQEKRKWSEEAARARRGW